MKAETWQENNNRYLSVALEWLRLRLLRLAQPVAPVASNLPQTFEAASPSFMEPFLRKSLTPTVPALPPPVHPDEQIAQLEKEMKAFEDTTPPPALITLRQQLNLSPFEGNVLLLCTAMELDTRIAGLCARAQDDLQRAYPTFALALIVFDDPAWEALSPDRPLRYWRLLEINQPGAQPLTTSALRADERIVNYIKGLNSLDDRLATFITPAEAMRNAQAPLPPSQESIVDQILQRWRGAPENTSLPIVQMVGPHLTSKQLIAARTAVALGRHLYQLMVESLPVQVNDIETLARLWQRESILLPLVLLLDAQETDEMASEHGAALRRFLARADGPIFFCTRELWPRLPRTSFSLEIAKPTHGEQQAAWVQVLGEQSATFAERLAAHFNLNLSTIAQVVEEVLNESNETAEQLESRVWAACSTIARPRLGTLAQRIDPKATWDDLVLPPEQTKLLHQIAQQVNQRHRVYEEWGFAQKMNRGLGISALFTGESGTGKTMAAEVIANELKIDLYRIDLSTVVSKYIGETEKNLRRVFDATEDSGMLLMDEADALFGKRSEVKDSHDRYANIEINYLLQRMESYRGLAILATNMKSALDQAFLRRLRFTVDFPFPTVNERKLIWQKVFPAQVPKEELDYDRLARSNIPGGNIHSIALNAAFLAAQQGSKVSMLLILQAMETELQKLGKPMSKAEFRV